MSPLFIHDAPMRAAALRTRLSTALEQLPAATSEPLLERLTPVSREAPTLVLTGHHSGGKSMLIKALTDGAAAVVIDADIATDTVTTYDWDGAVTLVDTPGVHAGVDSHDELALTALKGAELVLFVITPDLFDDRSAEHVRLVADGLGKRAQMMVVVNKAQTMFADPGVRREALAKALGDGTLPPMVECDAKNYVLSLTEADPQVARHLRDTSGIDDLRDRINAFSEERGDVAKLLQPFQLIRSLAAEAQASLVEDQDERVLASWLARVRRTLAEHEQSLSVDLDAKRAAYLRDSLTIAEGFAGELESFDHLDEAAWHTEFQKAAETLTQSINTLAERATSEMQAVVARGLTMLSSDMADIDEGPQATLIRNYPSTPQAPRPARGPLGNIRRRGTQAAGNAAESMRQAQDLLAKFRVQMGVGDGIRQSSGSLGHKVVKDVGHRLGKKFKPYEAVKMADKIGKVLKVAGVALQIGAAAHEVYGKEQAEVKAERDRATRYRTVVTNVQGGAREVIDEALREVHQALDENLQPAYGEIDELCDALTRRQGERSGLDADLQAIQDECADVTKLIGRASRARTAADAPHSPVA